MTNDIEDPSNKKNCNGKDCPVKKALSIFEGKYSLFIIKELLGGKKRFSEFLKNIPGLTSKTLNERLKYMAENDIVSRYSHPVIPPKVEYTLTDKGQSLNGVVKELKRFSEVCVIDDKSKKADKSDAKKEVEDVDAC